MRRGRDVASRSLGGFAPFVGGGGRGRSARSGVSRRGLATTPESQITSRGLMLRGRNPPGLVDLQMPRLLDGEVTAPVRDTTGVHHAEGGRVPRAHCATDPITFPCKWSQSIPFHSLKTVNYCLFLSHPCLQRHHWTRHCSVSPLTLPGLLIQYILFLPTKHNLENSPKHA